MRCYGNVKGRKYYGEQPEYIPEVHSKQRCPRCHTWRPKGDFIKDGEIKVYCANCRQYYKTAKSKDLKDKRAAAPKGTRYCGECRKTKSEASFTRRGRAWKVCNECADRRRYLRGR